jgi:UDP-GlcNAc:undecaprenyl-phosphate GlcNAc-1-phosphate transferase
MVVAVLIGVCLGFLPHNAHPARIFMGDSGSMLIGLMLAASAVSVTGRFDPQAIGSGAQIVPVFLPVLLPVAVLLLPLTDLVLAVVRRVLAGQSPFAADKLHLHHRLLSLGHTHGRAVGVLWLWTAVVSFGYIALAFLPLHLVLPTWAAVLLLAVLVTLGPRRARARRHGPVLLRERQAAERAAPATPPGPGSGPTGAAGPPAVAGSTERVTSLTGDAEARRGGRAHQPARSGTRPPRR